MAKRAAGRGCHASALTVHMPSYATVARNEVGGTIGKKTRRKKSVTGRLISVSILAIFWSGLSQDVSLSFCWKAQPLHLPVALRSTEQNGACVRTVPVTVGHGSRKIVSRLAQGTWRAAEK